MSTPAPQAGDGLLFAQIPEALPASATIENATTMSATPSFQSFISSPGSLLQPSLLDVTVKSNTVLNPQSASGGTVYDAWCMVQAIALPSPFTYTTYLYSSYEIGLLTTSVPGIANNKLLGNLDNINWLLNWYNGSNAAYGDVQGAIWKMLGSTYLVKDAGPQSAAKIDALVNEAMAHDGYVPEIGGKIAAVLDTTYTYNGNTTHYQPLLVTMQAASIGDTVWHDANANGIQDGGEAGIGGAGVTLVRDQNQDGDFADANETLATTTTDSAGRYVFKGLTPGLNYQVVFSLPAGYDGISPRQADGKVGGTGNSDALVSDVVVLANGENNNSIDAGFYKKASLGDRVWLDANGNGQQDANEAGVAGATVTLIGGGADGLIATTADNTRTVATTDANGSYAFTTLTPGTEYLVEFGAPAGAVFTAQDKANDALDSDANARGLSQVVKLASGENNTTIDAGVYVPASLGDRVWNDANANGRQDANEAGVAGAAVTLIGGGADGLLSTTGDNTSVTVVTDANGNYQFTNLTPGAEYQVQFSAPAGTVFTTQDNGGDAGDSDADGAGLSHIVKLASGENNTTIDAGVYVPASLGDRVWLDADGNGRQDANEAGIAGATVTLTGGGADGLISTTADNTTVTATTDADGKYQFAGLVPGAEYQVSFSAPEGMAFTARDKADDAIDSDADANGLSQVVTLAAGENNTTIDAGVYVPASLGDRVWLDANGNGRQDANEAGIAGATVTLTGGGADGLIATTDDNTTLTATTDADGRYAFTNLTPGMEYQVQFSAPAGTTFTAQNNGDDANDSDANASGLSQIVSLVSGENNTTIDAGVYVPATLGDRVWLDANGNGQQDASEAGVAGATVTLTGGGADGLIATAGDNTTIVTTTDANGKYAFTNLTPGMEYQVQFSAPAGTTFTAQDKGSDTGDSDADAITGKSQIVTLASGENNTTIDAGVYVPASLGDRVWLDANGNGQQDANEAGVAGATVTLTGGGADGLIATAGDNTTIVTTTDANGKYAFTNLTPGMEYQVQFSAPAGAVFTAQDKGGDTGDSDADAATGKSQIVTLVSGENNTTIDAGVYVPASLGDRVWLDTNGNGRQDTNEAGVAGATVTLTGGGADGLVSTVADNTTVTTTTDADGHYAFTNLTPGMEYQVQFSASAGTTFTAQNKGDDASDSDANASGLSQIVTLNSGENNTTIDAGVYVPASLGDRVWLDANGNGQQDANEAGVAGASVTLTGGGADGLIATAADNTTVSTRTDANGNYSFTNLTPGMEYQVQFSAPTGNVFTAQDKGGDASDSDANANGLSQIVKLASGENNTTIDAGVFAPASLGDRVWLDANRNGQQDTGEAGVAGATVTLTGGGADGLISTAADNVTFTTKTDANGQYGFSNLTPGAEYQVQFTAPTGMQFTSRDTGLDATDSDADAVTGKSQIVKLASGENNKTIDAGVYSNMGDLSITKTDGVTTVVPGQTVTYTIKATNTGSAIATDALVKDVLPSYLTNVTWTSSASAGASGNQLSGTGSINDAITLNGGASVTYTVKATVADIAALEKVSDFGALTNNVNLGQSIAVNGVRADAAIITSTGAIGSASLWSHNATADHGLGVLSGYESATAGDANELSNQAHKEVIRLTKTDGEQWSSVWISSLDKATAGTTVGTLYWSDSDVPNLATLTTKFTFKTGDFGLGAEEGNLLALRPANFDADAKYLFFVAGDGGSGGAGSDYLVWKAGTIPTAIANGATIAAPTGFVDTNTGNNSATDTDKLAVPAPAPVVRGSIGDTVWEDLNYNGVRETGENGIANVTVKLLDGANNLLATTVTNSSGNYLFNNLNAGSYKIEVVEPSNYYVTKQNVGYSDAVDSDIDTVAGRSGVITLSQGETDLSWDAGLYRKASIGDKVWNETDHDNIQDAGEAGIANVKVMLYTASGTLVATTLTNSAGNYRFSNLDPGSYFLKFDKTNVSFNGSNMNNWKWGSKNVGTNDAIDSDVTGDGVATTNLTRTDTTTLHSGENDMTWDAAITPIAIDLNGDGVHTVARSDSTGTFDLLGNGTAIASGWLSSSDGFLAVDRNGNGSIDDINELFGGNVKGAGFATLAGYDSNADGFVDVSDDAFAELRIWRDANGNHQTDSGELLSLADARVVSLKVDHVDLPFVDAQGNLHIERSSATLASGAVADMTDVYFAIDAKDGNGAPMLADLVGDTGLAMEVQVELVGQAPALMAA